MSDPKHEPRFDIYRSARKPSRFVTVPHGVSLQDAIPSESGIQVLDYLLYAAHARIGAMAGFRCDADAVQRDCDHQGFAHHQGLAAVEGGSSRQQEPLAEAEALFRRAAVLRERIAAWRRQLDEQGEAWEGYCHTLAAVIAFEARAEGLETRAWMAADQGWAA